MPRRKTKKIIPIGPQPRASLQAYDLLSGLSEIVSITGAMFVRIFFALSRTNHEYRWHFCESMDEFSK